ncbi:MAG: trypsin-like peptidase domain-containing protein, partial [Gammaproteobacteria bacterium]|nr:trypsin-like peptidase domain-containing protein [Gammaproteobacteria bacterium]
MTPLRPLPALFLLLASGAACAGNATSEQRWADTLARVSPSVVSIRVDATRAFDTGWNLTGQATGFVVDAEHGIILTNRHVVTSGPVVAAAVFEDHEVVTLKPIYRDPVHDFGFYRYDPRALKYIHPVSLKLAPAAARVGEDIRLIGNDAGEQLSILGGTLARVDRDAPDYGPGNYNDFNTFYMQAVSGTSGGSSGSPVINIDGEVIALNAGAREDAASSYFLPLERVVRALRLIQAGKPVPRGTLQTVFRHQYYDELERLGLPADTEAGLRRQYPQATGLLVVNQVQPGGPANGILQPGDILLSVAGTTISTFVPLAAVLDDSVGKTLAFRLIRGGLPVTVKIAVQNLDAITPASYLEFGGAVLNDLSYEQAHNFNVPVRGVYVANPGYVFGTAGITRAAVITEFDGVPVPDLDTFQKVLTALPDRAHATLRYYNLPDARRSILGIITVDRSWYPADRCQRDDASGDWPCIDLPPPPPAAALTPTTVSFPRYADARMQRLAPSLVYVNFDMPYPVDGVAQTHYIGTGVIVDAKRGLVVVDRDTVPVAMGDVRLTFAGSLEIPGRVVYVHPLHDLAVIQYDPKLLGRTPVRSIRFDGRPSRPGDAVWVVGYQPDQTLTSQETRVSSLDPVMFPLSPSYRFRDTNLEVLSLVNPPANVTGLLTDRQGHVTALWASFAFDDAGRVQEVQRGIPAYVVRDMLRIVESGGKSTLRTLDVEFYPVPLAQARKLGLPDDWAARLEAAEPQRRQVLAVWRLTADTPAQKLLQTGDLLLAVDGQPVINFRSVGKASRRPEVRLTLLRSGKVMTLDVPTVALNGQGTQRVLMWAGALLQKPQHAASAQRDIPPTGLLVGYYNFGSPASRYGLAPGLRIVAVDGRPTPDMDSFIAAVHDKHDGDVVRLTVRSADHMAQIITLKLDLRYWPTYEVLHTGRGWVRRSLISR